MQHKLRFWICLVLISAIFLIDGQLFSEGYRVRHLPDSVRQVAHLVLLLLVGVIGYFGWKNHPMWWTRRFWTTSYISIIALLLLTGTLHHLFEVFNKDILDVISNIRLFFTSPMPYLVLFLLVKLVQNAETTTK